MCPTTVLGNKLFFVVDFLVAVGQKIEGGRRIRGVGECRGNFSKNRGENIRKKL